MHLFPTTLGPTRLRLRAFPYNHRAREKRYDSRASIDLRLDDTDVGRSEPILADSKAVAFELWVPAGHDHDHDHHFQVYLGRDLTAWDDKLAVSLKLRGSHESADGDWDIWWAEPGDDDVEEIRKVYWCAAHAQATVCSARRTPLCHPDGTPVRTTVGLGYDQEYSALYHALLEDLAQTSIPGHLAEPFQRYMSFARRDPGDTLAYALYKRLRTVAGDIEKVARSIHARPEAALASSVGHRDLTATAAATYLQQRTASVAVSHVQQAVAHNGRIIPTAFTEVVPAATTDTPANRAAAFALGRVVQAVHLVRQHLQLEENLSPSAVPEHRDALQWLHKMSRRLRRYRRALPPPATSRASTASFDPRYASLQRLADTLDYVLGYVDGDTVPFEVQAFWQLYERWCFIQVVSALQECGFRTVGGSRQRSGFYRHPVPNAINCEMRHPDLPDTVLEVWFDKRFPVLRSRTDPFDSARPYGLDKRYGRNPSYRGWKNRPDIVLEFHRERSRASPDIIILDPTLRSRYPRPTGPRDPIEDKYDYLDGIRSFVSEDSRGDAQRRVLASWGITPSFQGDAPYALESPTSFNKGFVHLRPSHSSVQSAGSTLQQILEQTAILPAPEAP